MQMNCTTYVNLYLLEVVDSEQPSKFKPSIMLPFFIFFLNWLFHLFRNPKQLSFTYKFVYSTTVFLYM